MIANLHKHHFREIVTNLCTGFEEIWKSYLAHPEMDGAQSSGANYHYFKRIKPFITIWMDFRFVQITWPLTTHRHRRSSGLNLRAGAAIFLLIGWIISLAISVVPLVSRGPPSFTFDATSLHCWHDLYDNEPLSRSYLVAALLLGVIFPTAGECLRSIANWICTLNNWLWIVVRSFDN